MREISVSRFLQNYRLEIKKGLPVTVLSSGEPLFVVSSPLIIDKSLQTNQSISSHNQPITGAGAVGQATSAPVPPSDFKVAVSPTAVHVDEVAVKFKEETDQSKPVNESPVEKKPIDSEVNPKPKSFLEKSVDYFKTLRKDKPLESSVSNPSVLKEKVPEVKEAFVQPASQPSSLEQDLKTQLEAEKKEEEARLNQVSGNPPPVSTPVPTTLCDTGTCGNQAVGSWWITSITNAGPVNTLMKLCTKCAQNHGKILSDNETPVAFM